MIEMDCERFDELTLEFLYDELDELTAASARRHLAHCSRCQAIASKLRATKDITALSLQEPPEDLFDSILSAEEREQRQLPLSARASRTVSIMAGYAMRPQVAMAALLLLMIGTSLVFLQTDPSKRDQVAVTELGAPAPDPGAPTQPPSKPIVYAGETFEAPAGALKLEKSAAVDSPGAARPAQATYAEAMVAYQAGRYAEAERLFAEVAAAGGEKAAAAALHEGHAARNGSGCQRAAALYDAVSARYSGTVADEAAWGAATCYQTLGQLERARAHFVSLKSKAAFEERSSTALAAIDGALASRAMDSKVATASGDASANQAPTAANAKPAAKAKPAANAEKRKPPEKNADSATMKAESETTPSQESAQQKLPITPSEQTAQ